MKLQICNQNQAIALLKQYYGNKSRKYKIYAQYNSLFNKIITQQHLMVIPIDQRIATRAHGSFDVIYVKKLNIINLNSHINRLIKSTQSIGIQLPYQREKLLQIVINVVQTVFKRLIQNSQFSIQQLKQMTFGIRMVISSGYGDFGISSFGVNQFVVKKQNPNFQRVHSKTVNYINNALMSNEAKKLGAYQGIKATQQGIILQASVANVAFIFNQNQFVAPRFQTVIQGTTIKRLLKYVKKLQQQGIIKKIQFRDIKIQQAQKSKQMFVIGGDKIVPVLNFNGKQISKKRGKFAQMFQKWYQQQLQNSQEGTIINLQK